MEELLSELRKSNVLIRLEDGNLKVKMPKGVESKDLLMQIKSNKDELIEFIRERESLTNTFSPIPVAEKQPYYPLSAAQNRMYFLYEFDKDSLAYNMPKALKLEGKVDPKLIEQVFIELVQRHESLRTSFELVDDQVVQRIHELVDFSIDVHENTQPETVLDDFIQPFDLSQAPLVRVGLIQTAAEEHILAVDMHHIISDGSSHAVLIREFMDIYNAKILQEPRVFYKDYTAWQRSEERAAKLSEQKKFWLSKLDEEVPVVDLPLDFNRPLVKSHGGNKAHFFLTKTQLAQLTQLGDRIGASQYMTVLSVFNILLSKLSHQEVITVGTPVAGRDHPDLENMIGMFVNTLTLRNHPKGTMTFMDFLKTVKEECLACFDNQAYQYEELVDDLNLERATDRNPLFDILFVFQNYQNEELSIPGLKVTSYPMEPVNAKFDVQLIAVEQLGELHFTLEYATDLFLESTIERFICYFKRIVEGVLKNPDQLLREIDVLHQQERNQLLKTFNATKADFPSDQTVIDLFDEQARNGSAVALTMNGTELSYGEMHAQVNALADHLLQSGLKPGEVVGVLYDRSFEMMIAIYAIMKAGGAYLPISAAYPQGRIDYILENSKPVMVLAPAKYHAKISDAITCIDLAGLSLEVSAEVTVQNQSTPDGLAYVIYTSGSTGSPKGVMINHRSLMNRLHWMQRAYSLDSADRLLQKTPTVFDVSLWELFWWSQQGASLSLLAVDGEKDPEELCQTIYRDGITTIHFVPSMLQAFLDHVEASGNATMLGSLRQVFCSGEALPIHHVRRFEELLGATNNSRLINLYGPTEATVDVSYFNCEDYQGQQSIPIGKPIDNTMLLILDRYDQLQPKGVVGELCIGGVGVGMGYLNNEKLSREKFVDNPFIPGARMYRTGDLARWLPDGNIEYLGRMDHQVKIRGYRIELGEIEHALRQVEDIKEAVVIARTHDSTKHLVGYYVADQALEVMTLRGALAQTLPDYMIPTFFVHLEKMPLTSNGKLDRKSLPAPEATTAAEYVAPRTAEEKMLCEIWADVLGLEQVGIRDNFFSIGGDSIKSIQISSRVRKLGFQLTIQDLFTSQYIEELAPRLKHEIIEAEQGLVTGEGELTPIQRWFFNQPMKSPHHFNLSMLLDFSEGISTEEVRQIFSRLVEHHDALRMVFPEANGNYHQKNLESINELSIATYDLRENEDQAQDILRLSEQLQASLSLEHGPLIKLGLYRVTKGSRLFVAVHHLIMDGVSWRVLFEDIEQLYDQLKQGNRGLKLPAKTEPFLNWASHLTTYQQSQGYQKSINYWEQAANKNGAALPRDFEQGKYVAALQKRVDLELDQQQTKQLLMEAHRAFGTQMNDLLLTGLMITLQKSFGLDNIRLDMEGHGREEVGAAIDISRTIGWFTSIFPVHLKASVDLSMQIRSVKEALRAIPKKGFDYLLFANETEADMPQSPIFFEYFGQIDQDLNDRSFSIANENIGANISQNEVREYDWRISGRVENDQLKLSVAYSTDQYREETVKAFAEAFQSNLGSLTAFCVDQEKVTLSPSDVGYSDISIQALETLQQQYELSDVYPLSPMQEGMLFHSLAETDSAQYFDQMTFRVNGALQIDQVASAMSLLMERHDVLRTLFLPDRFDRAVQVVLKERAVDFTYHDIREEVALGNLEEVTQQYKEADKSRKFDMTEDTLIRLTVLRVMDEEYVFIWSHHHILMDGWCMSIIVNEYSYLYTCLVNAEPMKLAPARPYGTYIQWLQARDDAKSKAYWSKYLSGYENQASFPKKEGAVNVGNNEYELQKRGLTIDADNTTGLKAICAANGVTPNTIIQAIWAILLSRYNNTDDVIFGAVVSGRPSEIVGVEEMVGLFINTIPVRIRLKTDDTLPSLLNRIQRQALQTEDHHYSPLYEVQQLSELGRDLMDHILVFENYPVADKIQDEAHKASNTTVKEVNIFEQDNYDLSLEIQVQDVVKLELSFNALVYESEQIQKLLSAYEFILQQLVANPTINLAELAILQPQEQQVLLHDFNDSFTQYPENETFPGLFTEVAAQFPERIAVSDGKEELTYKELNELTNRIANYLQSRGLEKGQIIPLVLPRANPLMACMVGIQKAGYVFVAIDVEHPLSRITGIIDDCMAQLVMAHPDFKDALEKSVEDIPYHVEMIADGAEAKDLFAQYPSDNVNTSLTPEDITYMIYTSGSTGKPKGVLLHQQGMVNHFRGLIDLMRIDEQDCLAQTAECSFDIFVVQALLCLMVGGRTEIVAKEVMLDAKRFSSLIDEKGITLIELVPTVLKFLLDDHAFKVKGDHVRWLISCGERLTRNLSEDWYEQFPNTQVVNAYGPAEASDDVTAYVVPRYEQVSENYHVPIGKPLANVKMYILDDQLRMCPVGVRGEICISGIAVGKGYWRNEAQTQKKFVPNPYVAEVGEDHPIIYRTGDNGFWQEDGNMVFLGRIDNMVKVRGARIELGEVESVMLKVDAVEQVVVVVKDAQLCGYYVTATGLEILGFKEMLKEMLPDFMMPTYLVHLEAMPLTGNGKIDRRALPDPDVTSDDQYDAPQGEMEVQMAKIWSEILGIERSAISATRSFFDLGGHSLNAVKLIFRIEKDFGVKIPLSFLFQQPAIREICTTISVAKIKSDKPKSAKKIII